MEPRARSRRRAPAAPPAPRRRARLGRPPADYSARDQILAGAATAFGRLGYARTSVQEILHAAGVSRRTFYRVYRSKDDVFGALFDQTVAASLQLVRDAIARAPTPPAKLAAGVAAYLGAAGAIGPLARVLLLEQFPPGSRFHRRREAAVEEFIALVEQEYGGLRRERVDPLLFRGLVAAIDYVAVQLAGASGGGPVDEARGQRVMFRILGAVLAGPGDPVPPLPLLDEPR